MSHTPGPWELGASGTDIYYTVTPDSWVYVASANSRGAGDNDEANARLIAAAPELLEELKRAREDVESWGAYASAYFQAKHRLAEDLARIDAVIAKATPSTERSAPL